eukprot:10352106-Prorocentrum_lima.AAC.1
MECVKLAVLVDEAPEEEQVVARVCAYGNVTLPLGVVALQAVTLLEQLRGVRAGKVHAGDA